ncbi:MAG: ribosome small subunit-dependent GTPase A [Bacteroidetes bacterium]|nr:ribosome small subunit-dependent GTPase A [Bacteroidota bacterium]
MSEEKKSEQLNKGRVIRSTGSWYSVIGDDNVVRDCRLRGKYRLEGVRTTNPVAVGDLVRFKIEDGKETAVIESIFERTNVIIRKSTKLSKAAHIIASNMDQALLVATIDQPRTSTGFIDRFLATTEAYHLQAVLIFNKFDLYSSAQIKELEVLQEVYSKIGYKVLAVSAHTAYHLDDLKVIMKDKVSLFSGHSGVGKSALVNALDAQLNVRIGDISSAHQKGKHTTTFAEMHQLSFGGWIIDTPGIKEFGLYDLEKETLAQRFPEMRQIMAACRFANCTHRHEPGCAVKAAVESGAIAAFRYKNYLNMMTDNELY